MNRYRFIKQKAFESLEKFEDRINKECGTGWKIAQFAGTQSGLYVIVERETHH